MRITQRAQVIHEDLLPAMNCMITVYKKFSECCLKKNITKSDITDEVNTRTLQSESRNHGACLKC